MKKYITILFLSLFFALPVFAETTRVVSEDVFIPETGMVEIFDFGDNMFYSDSWFISLDTPDMYDNCGMYDEWGDEFAYETLFGKIYLDADELDFTGTTNVYMFGEYLPAEIMVENVNIPSIGLVFVYDFGTDIFNSFSRAMITDAPTVRKCTLYDEFEVSVSQYTLTGEVYILGENCNYTGITDVSIAGDYLPTNLVVEDLNIPESGLFEIYDFGEDYFFSPAGVVLFDGFIAEHGYIKNEFGSSIWAELIGKIYLNADSITYTGITDIHIAGAYFEEPPPPPLQVITISSMASTSDMLASVGTLFSDLWGYIAVIAGIPLAFYIITRIQNLILLKEKKK